MRHENATSVVKCLAPTLGALLLGSGTPDAALPLYAALRLYEPEMDDETADTAERIAEGRERVEPETITTGHFILSDDTARYRRTFGIAPSLMTPWEIGLYDHEVTSATHFHLTARYDDLERERGQYRAVVLGLQFGQPPAPETAPAPETSPAPD